MEIRKHVIDGIMVIELMGDLDGRSAPSVQEQLLHSMPANERIVLDLSGVAFVSSAGLRTMLLIYRQAQSVNTSVALVGLSAEIRSVLSATGFLGFFIVADRFVDGLAALREPEREGSGAV
jgi:anti-sigma B factor antagonist